MTTFPMQISHHRKVRYLPDYVTGCWIWQMGTCGRPPHVYGSMRFNWEKNTAHRIFYRELVGPIPDGYDVHHVCENKLCVNPEHLEVLPEGDHARLHNKNHPNAAKTHCPDGHPYDGVNTHVTKTGARHCRACDRQRHRSRYRYKEANGAGGLR